MTKNVEWSWDRYCYVARLCLSYIRDGKSREDFRLAEMQQNQIDTEMAFHAWTAAALANEAGLPSELAFPFCVELQVSP